MLHMHLNGLCRLNEIFDILQSQGGYLTVYPMNISIPTYVCTPQHHLGATRGVAHQQSVARKLKGDEPLYARTEHFFSPSRTNFDPRLLWALNRAGRTRRGVARKHLGDVAGVEQDRHRQRSRGHGEHGLHVALHAVALVGQ